MTHNTTAYVCKSHQTACIWHTLRDQKHARRLLTLHGARARACPHSQNEGHVLGGPYGDQVFGLLLGSLPEPCISAGDAGPPSCTHELKGHVLGGLHGDQVFGLLPGSLPEP